MDSMSALVEGRIHGHRPSWNRFAASKVPLTRSLSLAPLALATSSLPRTTSTTNSPLRG